MSTIKVSIFDPEKIRAYMNGSPDVLEKVASVQKSRHSDLTDSEAQEAAIRLVQQRCQEIWRNDKWVSDEYEAFCEFQERELKYYCGTGTSTSATSTSASDTWRKFVGDKKSLALYLVLCLLGGTFGLHKFYLGKWKGGLLYLFTGGLLGFGIVYDFLRGTQGVA